MKYVYNVEMEAFRREDKRGKPLYINITEANRIINLLNMGYSVASINGKISLNNPKGTVTTINSFIRNYNEGNIIMPENAPAPVHIFESITDTDRIDELEKRVANLENKLSGSKCNCFVTTPANESKEKNTLFNKVKSWMP